MSRQISVVAFSFCNVNKGTATEFFLGRKEMNVKNSRFYLLYLLELITTVFIEKQAIT